jgi:hypothetical protein
VDGSRESGPVAGEHVAGGLLPTQDQDTRRSWADTRTNQAARRWRGAPVEEVSPKISFYGRHPRGPA